MGITNHHHHDRHHHHQHHHHHLRVIADGKIRIPDPLSYRGNIPSESGQHNGYSVRFRCRLSLLLFYNRSEEAALFDFEVRFRTESRETRLLGCIRYLRDEILEDYPAELLLQRHGSIGRLASLLRCVHRFLCSLEVRTVDFKLAIGSMILFIGWIADLLLKRCLFFSTILTPMRAAFV